MRMCRSRRSPGSSWGLISIKRRACPAYATLERILWNLHVLAIFSGGQMGIVTGDCHIECIDHIHCGLPAPQDGIDEVIAEVAVRAAVSSRRDTRRQGV